MFCHFQEDDLEEVEGRDDILVMVVSSVAGGWGLSSERYLGEIRVSASFSRSNLRLFKTFLMPL